MPKWRFVVVSHFAGRQQRRAICARIKQRVEQRGLSDVLPLVKYEVGRRGEYYLGVAYDAQVVHDDQDALDRVTPVLREAGLSAKPGASWCVEPEEIAGLLRGTLECESFTVPIRYERRTRLEIPPVTDLLAAVDPSELLQGTDASESAKYQRLLHWCSAVGAGDLSGLQLTCDLLGISTEWGGAWSVLRRLTLLGHLEFSAEPSVRWSIAPLALVTPVADSEAAYLAGQRTPRTSEMLEDESAIERVVLPGAPVRLLIRDPESIALRHERDIALSSVGCVASQMAARLPVFDDWFRLLPVWDEVDLHRFDIFRYEPHFDSFEPTDSVHLAPLHLHRFVFDHNGRSQTTLAIKESESGSWRCGDYYGLRFASRKALCGCRAMFRAEDSHLIVPSTDRWPMPYERALVLASGLLPQQVRSDEEISLLVYDQVTEAFAELMCRLVGVELERE